MTRLAPWRVFSLTAILVVASCGPTTIYYRDGAEVSRIESELTSCQVSALGQVPVLQRQRYIPPQHTYRTFCHPTGGCYTQPILLSPGYFQTYDANEGLRRSVTQACMTEKGFDRLALPQCSSGVIQRTTITRTRVQPTLTADACIIRIRSGGYQIVNP